MNAGPAPLLGLTLRHGGRARGGRRPRRAPSRQAALGVAARGLDAPAPPRRRRSRRGRRWRSRSDCSGRTAASAPYRQQRLRAQALPLLVDRARHQHVAGERRPARAARRRQPQRQFQPPCRSSPAPVHPPPCTTGVNASGPTPTTSVWPRNMSELRLLSSSLPTTFGRPGARPHVDVEPAACSRAPERRDGRLDPLRNERRVRRVGRDGSAGLGSGVATRSARHPHDQFVVGRQSRCGGPASPRIRARSRSPATVPGRQPAGPRPSPPARPASSSRGRRTPPAPHRRRPQAEGRASPGARRPS